MTKRSFRRYAAAASVAVVVMTSCGDDDRETTSWAGASSVTAVTSATVGATEAGTSAPDVPTDGSASAATSAGEGTTSPVSGATSGDSSTGGDSTADGGTGASSTEAATTTTTTGARPEDGPADRPGDGFETTTAGAEGCTQVDFLFVIDSSVSMEGEQAALTAAFPAFLATIADTLPTDDYQIMVVDTDAASRCSPAKCTHETCQAAGQHVCMDIFEACDTTLGAGVVHPAGEYTANKVCDFGPGQRYLPGSDPQLHANFKCAAEVGTAGDPEERPMDAMVAAVSAGLQAPGGCNDGFLREEAILVVTFISDDENVEDLNTAQQTHDALVAAKGGDADRIVMLGLIPGVGCGPGGLHWAQLIGLFGTHGIQGEVCSPDYNGFFQDAVTTILDACVINPG
jgi:hypothetical protein